MNILPALLPQGEVPRVYGRLAPVYDVWAALTESRARRRAVELANVRDGEDLLEVAVGTGALFAELVAKNPHGRNEGIDITPEMAEKARKRVGGRANVRVGDAHRLDFESGAFDLVVNGYMFDLLPQEDFPAVLGEMHRVLRPGGRLLLINMAASQKKRTALWTAIYKLNPAMMGGCRGVLLEQPVRDAGFELVHREELDQFGFPTELLLARKKTK
jgi:ubiquinone/menaquinone biosynthesis C-methylase UbiE